MGTKFISALLIATILALSCYALVINTPTDRDTLIIFLQEDPTDQHAYIKGEYMCGHFSEDLIKNASKYGIRMFPVGLLSNNESDHPNHLIVGALSDDTFLFIEPQADEIFELDNYRDKDKWPHYKVGLIITHMSNSSQIFGTPFLSNFTSKGDFL